MKRHLMLVLVLLLAFGNLWVSSVAAEDEVTTTTTVDPKTGATTVTTVNHKTGETSSTTNSGPSTSSGNTTGSSDGYDKIDHVISGHGTTTQNGQVISNSGIDVNSKTGKTNADYVNDTLNAAAKLPNIVSGNSWSRTKSWKIGADGKPEEVRESYHEGKLDTSQSHTPAPPPTDCPSTPTTEPPSPPTAPPTQAPVTPPTAAPTTAAAPPTGVPTPPTAPSTPPTAAVPGNPVPPTTAAIPPQKKGTEIAPTKLPVGIPPATVILSIHDPISPTDQSFNSSIDPATIARPIPEDTRARFGLEIAQDMDPSKITVTVTDPEDPKEQGYARNIFHVFRTPSDDKYSVSVFYPDAVTKTPKKLLLVKVPVYRMNFKNRTIDTTSGRTSDSDVPAAANNGAPISNIGNSSSGGYGSTSPENDAKNDFSDLYNDPSVPSNEQGNTNADAHIAGAITSGKAATDGSTDGTAAGAGAGSSSSGNSSTDDPSAIHAAGSTAINSSSDQAGTQVAAAPHEAGKSTAGMTAAQRLAAKAKTAKAAGAGSQGSTAGSSQGSSGNNSSTCSTCGSSDGSSAGSSGGSSITGSSAGSDATAGSDGGTSANVAVSDGSSNTIPDAPPENSNGGLKTAAAQGGVTTAQKETAVKSHIVCLSMRSAAAEAGQSFDFVSDQYPTAQALKVNTPVDFSIDIGQNVKREAVTVVLFDGKSKTQITGNSFQAAFPAPTAEAYVWIYGDAEGKSFSYKVSIPVQGL
ncbi:MAG: hypothetical protein HQM09_07025 [Candidatus Riflebacteria bacterium]|nr:hypothetical protein [Candidatus Riflebacteria bacterium]